MKNCKAEFAPNTNMTQLEKWHCAESRSAETEGGWQPGCPKLGPARATQSAWKLLFHKLKTIYIAFII
jgi:hypothetical protein